MLPGKNALRIRDFRRLWYGQAVSQLGDAVYGLLFIFMADRFTKDPAVVGVVAALNALPYLVIGPFAGVVADRCDRRTIMLYADVLSAIVLLGFLLLTMTAGRPPLWSLFLTPFLLSTVKSFFLPAKSACIAKLVPEDTLLEATALSQATQNLMLTCGLFLAGALLGPFERMSQGGFFELAVSANLPTFLVSAAFVRLLPSLVPDRAATLDSHPMVDLRAGALAVARHKVLAPLLAANLLVNLFISGFIIVYTATNRAWFDGTFQSLAYLEVGFVLSLVVSSLLLPKFKIVKVGVSYAVGTFFIGLTVAMMAFSKSYGSFMWWNVAAGLCLPFMTIPTATYMNLAVPDEMRGRVNAFSGMVSAGIQPLGAAMTGFFLRSLGLVAMYIVMGLGMSLAGVLPLLSKDFRAAENPRPAD